MQRDKKITWFLCVLFLSGASDLHAFKLPFPDFQVSAWAVWHYAVKPQPRATSPGSKVRMGGTGGGIDLTVRYFLPFYFGPQYEYIPVYSESGSANLPGNGDVAYGANLYGHYFAGAIYLPMGDWVYELFFDNERHPMSLFWQSMLRAPYAKGTYGMHHMYATLTTNGDDSSSSAVRFGYTGEIGLMFMVFKTLRIYAAFDYHSIYEDGNALLGLKLGAAYRYKLKD